MLNLWRLFETGELRADNDNDGVLIVAVDVCNRFFLFFCWSKFSTVNRSEASIWTTWWLYDTQTNYSTIHNDCKCDGNGMNPSDGNHEKSRALNKNAMAADDDDGGWNGRRAMRVFDRHTANDTRCSLIEISGNPDVTNKRWRWW